MDSAIIDKIETALNGIRPYLEADGGNVRLVEVTDDFVVKLELEGTCISCPMSAMTMKAGIEDSIKKALPQVKSVEAINMVPVL
ncbi:MAG: NifU family protein [Bacteroidota bacterium]|nr:NifU family protein [Bacteroidota bacterium]